MRAKVYLGGNFFRLLFTPDFFLESFVKLSFMVEFVRKVELTNTLTSIK